MSALFDMYKVDLHGSAMWMGSVHSYSFAAFEIALTAAKAPGDYLIANRQTGERTALSFGLSVDGRHDHVTPISQQASTAQIRGSCDEEAE
jgi:hypothetical protein